MLKGIFNLINCMILQKLVLVTVKDLIMKKVYNTLGFIFIALQIFSQTLTTELEAVNSAIGWPWNWDMVGIDSKLITVNENGTLNIRIDGKWENIDVDPNVSNLEARGIALDDSGKIWFTTTEHGLWSYDDNGVLENFTASNSFLPIDNLRNLAIQNNIFWISTDGMGLIRHNADTNETLHFTTNQYPDLKSDFNLDPYIDSEGNVWFRNREFLTKISPDLVWTNEDMRFHISGGRVNDIHIESETEIWLAMNGGVILFDGTDYNVIIESQFDNYQQVLKDTKGNIWLTKTSTINDGGLTIIRDGQEYFYNSDDDSAIPSQVFELVEQRDSIMAVGTIGNSISKMHFDFPSSLNESREISIKVYPNPAESTIQVEVGNENVHSNWYVTDLNGNTLIKGNAIPKQIDVSSIDSGVYLLTIENGKTLTSKKITILSNHH